MIAFDTNHLVRHIVQDDPRQCGKVTRLITREAAAGRNIRVLDLVLLETAWVLESVYGFDRAALAHVFDELLEDSAFSFDDSQRLRRCLRQFAAGKADFADYLILSAANAVGLALETFDKTLIKELRR
ncbi:MAG: type II toxin-antitoxin system VapC family toxin [Opitutales bacterium]|nr:type II toxin-antitoxin system VapC family toxin [Opitutales bacterium]